MKCRLTIEQSKELTTYSDTPDKYNGYIYSLDNLLELIPKKLDLSGLTVYFFIHYDYNNVYSVGYFVEVTDIVLDPDFKQDKIIIEHVIFINSELIDALFDLLKWVFDTSNAVEEVE